MAYTENIELCDMWVEVEFDYQPGEPEVRYYRDGSGYPGSPPEITIEKVLSPLGHDHTRLFSKHDKLWEWLEKKVWEKIESIDPYDYYEPDYDALEKLETLERARNAGAKRTPFKGY